jgi:hypothetical protein
MTRLWHWLRCPEVIGPEPCPIIHRWTICKVRGRKLFLHHFLANVDERDLHDHPWPFVTFVLWGRYDDITEDGRERLRAGSWASREALHTHRTHAGPKGAWTVVLTGRWKRRWGFWRDETWWPWREYERAYGPGMRCDNEKENDHDRIGP